MKTELLLELLRSRRSIRRYTGQLIHRESVGKLLEAARWAPSAHNKQHWRWVILTEAEEREKLAAAMGERLARTLGPTWIAREGPEDEVQDAHVWIEPPIWIVAFMSMKGIEPILSEAQHEAERLMAIQSVSAAIQNLLLAAETEGLGATWHCIPLYMPDVVRDVLGLPEDYEPQALITLGHPATEGGEGRRGELEVIWK
jgi:F420 biosynthesis protein FbiB-like protein